MHVTVCALAGDKVTVKRHVRLSAIPSACDAVN